MAPLPHPAHRTGQQISRIRLSDKTSRLAFARNANNGLKTAARRSQCSVADGIQVDHNHQLAGSLFRPRSTKVGRHSGSSASSSHRFGRRRNGVAMAISLSIRASWAPRQSSLCRGPRPRRSGAGLNTASERQRAYIGSGDIQSIRPIRIDCWVSIGRPQQAEHALSLRDFLPANVVDVLERITRSITDREQADGHEYQRENSISVATPAGRSRMRGHKDGCQQNTLPDPPRPTRSRCRRNCSRQSCG
jgi:hypothetical protein